MKATADIASLARGAALALKHGAINELEVCAKQILAMDSHYADAWFFLSIAATERKRIKLALELIDNAIRLAPDPNATASAGPNTRMRPGMFPESTSRQAEYIAHKARLHTMMGERDAALAAAEQGLALAPGSPVALDTLGVVFSRFERHEKAREVLRRSVDVAPDNAQFQFNLAAVEQFLGNAEAAERHYQHAIRLKPDFYRAYWALSELEKNAPAADRLETLLGFWKRAGLSAEDRLYLGHCISREYEKLEDYGAAFRFLDEGKSAMRAKINYRIDQDRALFKALKSAFSHPFSRAFPGQHRSGERGERCIFVMGMPRTGTTLVDRILSAHSRVVSIGEAQDLPRAVKRVSKSTSPVLLDAAMATRAAELDCAGIARQYLDSVASRVAQDDYSLDKTPLNFLYTGFILAALPDARVICLRRHPMDTILSNFRQLFAVKSGYYHYNYDLQATAQYFCLFEELVKRWRELFGARFYELRYEALVAEPEPRVRDLCAYTGIDFEPACLEFYQSAGAVSTPSAMQVRQPLYRSAVDRWKRYGDHLQPALEILDKQGIHLG